MQGDIYQCLNWVNIISTNSIKQVKVTIAHMKMLITITHTSTVVCTLLLPLNAGCGLEVFEILLHRGDGIFQNFGGNSPFNDGGRGFQQSRYVYEVIIWHSLYFTRSVHFFEQHA